MVMKETRTSSCPPDRVSSGWKIELLDTGHSASRMWIVDRTMRIGGSEVKIGGISSVETEEKYRGQGLASRVMRGALALMKREGYSATILHGIPDFYHRFGYTCCIPEYELRIPTLSAEKVRPLFGRSKASSGLKVREVRREDIPAIVRIYNRENAARTGSIVRDAKAWQGFPRSAGFFTKPGMRAIVDGREKVAGYLVFDDEASRCRASEAGGTGWDVQAVILEFLARRAVDLGKEEVTLTIPPDHPFALFCREFGCESHIRYPCNGEFMGLILDLRAFMDKAASGIAKAGPKGRLAISTELGNGVLEVGSRGSRFSTGSGRGAVKIPHSFLLQMVMGYRSAPDLTAAGILRMTKSQASLLNAWFPLRHAHMWWADRF